MKILVVGGGTGGHVTPIRPVLSELKALHPNVHTMMIGHKGDGFSDKMLQDANLDKLYVIHAGKWRRYRDDSWLQRLFDIKTHVLNGRDLFYIGAGLIESVGILRKERPDAIFIKGGYVGVPVGIAASWLKIPFITHDSDALPGLANRMIASRAVFNAVGAPARYYSYPTEKLREVGVPIAAGFKQVTKKQQRDAKAELGLLPNDLLVVVTGGSQGAQRINQVMVAIADTLSAQAHIVHITGVKNHLTVQKAVGTLGSKSRSRYQVIDFTDHMARYLQAADVVITRAGATMIAELGALRKPAIFVPAPQLADQAMNVELLRAAGVLVLDEHDLIANPNLMLEAISSMLTDDALRQSYAKAVGSLARPNAAKELAQLVNTLARRQK